MHGGTVKGSINYETGEFELWDCPPHAEFHGYASHVSSLAGGQTTKASSGNVIHTIKARSVNSKVNTEIQLTIKGD